MNTVKNKQEILEVFRENPDMMAILTIIRDLDLKDSWLAAGSVRNFIWNLLSDKSLLTVKQMWTSFSLIQIFLMRKPCP